MSMLSSVIRCMCLLHNGLQVDNNATIHMLNTMFIAHTKMQDQEAINKRGHEIGAHSFEVSQIHKKLCVLQIGSVRNQMLK